MMEDVIGKWVRDNGRLHFTLIDPEKQEPEAAGRLAAVAEEYGSDAIMVGGSTIEGGIVDDTVRAVKTASRLPTILFPSTAAGVSTNSDYIFWMMLVNSNNRRFLVGEQVKAAIPFSKTNVKPIPMGYIVVSTSGTPTEVEKVGEVDRIRDVDFEKAVSYALASEYFGMHCVYLEAGSGAEKPVPAEMIRSVKDAVSVPVIVGGGIRSGGAADTVVDAGADVVVTGTIAEKDPLKLGEIIGAVKR
ncbi:MAG: geranylgeranylglyceryl/heptaprenylglyceryl phosphate synthase [Candidatus Altiarchaeota archaeon]